eukprot:CAMPEP_0172188758 /NCGR_PEP_ID=MMETSP1050-20130122/22132_1 /TAXON_ID=233186 /ORGANISM="Cryptomonas curvata, Strain CCAP979/52" /LENGTH=172 /DNA_ID=CAMNT_0012863349 /DNA_START=44 /DNA_END=562 /DNA_ORIENTATION=-
MVFETLHHFSQLVQINPAANHLAVQVHPHQALNLVGGNDETYNSAPGGSFDHGSASAWSHDYAIRPINAEGLDAEGGAGGPFACDSDGFACFVYNKGVFDNVISGSGSVDQAVSRIADDETGRVYTTFGVGSEISHGRGGELASTDGGLGMGARSCPLAVDCNGDPAYHLPY